MKLSEVKTHNNGKSCYIVIHNKVYDVTKFLEEHPGGEEVLLEQAGCDGTESFEDVGHSIDARELMEKYYVDDLDECDHTDSKPTRTSPLAGEKAEEGLWSKVSGWIAPVAIALTAAFIYKYYLSQN